MKYMLDTNICIYAIKNKPPEVIKNFLAHNPDDICISSITYGELMHGVEKARPLSATVWLSHCSCRLFSFCLLELKLQKNMERFVLTLKKRDANRPYG